MSLLEGALVFLILIWTVIFLIIAFTLWFIFRAIKRAMNKVDKILDETEQKAEELDLPSKFVTTAAMAFLSKKSFGTIYKIFSAINSGKKKKK